MQIFSRMQFKFFKDLNTQIEKMNANSKNSSKNSLKKSLKKSLNKKFMIVLNTGQIVFLWHIYKAHAIRNIQE